MRRFKKTAVMLLLFACSSNGVDGATKIGDRVPEDGRCGGIAGRACQEGLWCDPDPGHCTAADIQGVCIAVPEICTRHYRPVCGCDGRTYGNDCSRRSAKVAMDRDGECGAID